MAVVSSISGFGSEILLKEQEPHHKDEITELFIQDITYHGYGITVHTHGLNNGFRLKLLNTISTWKGPENTIIEIT